MANFKMTVKGNSQQVGQFLESNSTALTLTGKYDDPPNTEVDVMVEVDTENIKQLIGDITRNADLYYVLSFGYQEPFVAEPQPAAQRGGDK